MDGLGKPHLQCFNGWMRLLAIRADRSGGINEMEHSNGHVSCLRIHRPTHTKHQMGILSKMHSHRGRTINTDETVTVQPNAPGERPGQEARELKP